MMTHSFVLRYVFAFLFAGALLFFVYFSLFPLIVFAANEVTIDEDITLILPSDSTEYTLLGGSKFDSLTINNANFAFVMSAGGKATLESSARKLLKTSDINKSTTCTDSKSSIIIELDPGNSDGKTVTVTPSSDTCASIGAGGGSGGGGGGGSGGTGTTGSGSAAPAIPPQPIVPLPPVAAQETPTAPSVSVLFSSDLIFGMQNADITRLQILLARDKTVYPEGLVTGYFGSLTKKAVQNFQLKYSIAQTGSPGFGRVGPKTRAKLQAMFGGVSAPAPAPPSPVVSVTISSLFTSGLGKGVSNADVKRLQQLLNSDPDTRLADSGIGSPGQETNFFGSVTGNAVERFQKKYGVAREGDLGFGYVGPKTRVKLQEVFGNIQP